MTSKAERFWILFILRFAFGLFFLVASINIFSAGGPHDFGPDWFAKMISKSYETGWTGDLLPMIDNPFHGIIQNIKKAGEEEVASGEVKKAAAQEAAGATEEPASKPASKPEAAAAKKKDEGPPPEKVHATYVFAFLMPFFFAILAVPIITGIFLRPALRLSALLLIVLGIGKYISDRDLSTTANDFFFAFLICLGLYVLGQGRREQNAEHNTPA